MTASLVVNADDLGVSEGATLGVLRGHREGVITSASLCVTTPCYRHALETCVHACPGLGVGLHVTLTLGSSVAGAAHVPTLVDAHGRFRWRFLSLLRAAGLARDRRLLDEIRAEVDAQFARASDDGVVLDHVDSERHVHLIPGIFEIVADAARRHGIGFIRTGRDLGASFVRATDVAALVLGGGALKWGLLSQLAGRGRALLGTGLASADGVISYLYTGRVHDVLAEVLRRPIPGITEVMVHPGVPDAAPIPRLGNLGVERYLASEDRRRELDACIAAKRIATEWQLTTYRALAASAT